VASLLLFKGFLSRRRTKLFAKVGNILYNVAVSSPHHSTCDCRLVEDKCCINVPDIVAMCSSLLTSLKPTLTESASYLLTVFDHSTGGGGKGVGMRSGLLSR
jgi:hypothetical protein